MKKRISILAIALAITAIAHAATNDLAGLLQKGLFEEEANRNLDAAISNYQTLANAFDKDRQVAATAIFRLGECYRKLGRTNEAAAQYQRIVREFTDQQTLATLSQQNLAGLGASNLAAESPQSGAAADTLQQLQNLLAATTVQNAKKEATLNALRGMDREQLRNALPTMVPDGALNLFLGNLNAAEENLARLKPDYSADHPKYKNAQATVDELNAKVDQRIDGILLGLQKELDADNAYLASLQSEIQKIQNSNRNTLNANDNPSGLTPITDEEEKEIRRIQMMIRNSPDLINAPSGDPRLTPLARAASLGQLRVAKFLIEAKADVNQRSVGMTPLQQAALNGHRAMVELLLANGADVNAKGSNDRTALHTAAEHGFVSVMETLLATNADVNTQDPLGITPLTLAVQNGFRQAAELLLSRGADPNRTVTKVPQGWSMTEESVGAPLHFAVLRGDEPMVSLLLNNRANTEVRNPYDETALNLAAHKGAIEIARRLLDAGANPNPERSNPGDPTPLYRAVSRGDTNLVSLLLAKGADPNEGCYTAGGPSEGSYQNPSGVTPLMKAAQNGNEVIVRLLLQNNANPNLKDGDGYTAFWHGFNARDAAKCLIPLVESGADPNQFDQTGRTPLMGVAEFNSFLSSTDRLAVARLLIAKGADVNARSPQGNTALHWAVLYKRPELVELLLANKADVNVANKDGKTPLDLAKEDQRSGRTVTPGYVSSFPGPPPLQPMRFPGTPYSPGMAVPGGAGKAPETSAPPQDIVTLLRQHGAVDELPNFDAIRVTRQGIPSPVTLFNRPSNNWNQITLFDVLGVQYQLISRYVNDWNPRNPEPDYYSSGNENNSLPFPDLAHIVVHRPSAEGNRSAELKINAARAFDSGDCAADVPLRFGDVLEIPEADHVMYAQWRGLQTNELLNLKNCLTRHVEVTVKGKTTNLTIAPQIDIPGALVEGPEGYRLEVFLHRLEPVMLWPALQKSKLLLASSDLSRIKVKRHDAATGKTHEWMVDCSNPQERPNFWLRDGDLVEVPEKAAD